jgi:CRISP-associated protein Cas1
MATLYVTEPGARVEKEYRRLLVTLKDEVLMSVPIMHVSHVVLVGYTGVTTPAMISLLDSGVGLSLVTRSGKLRGRLQPPGIDNLPLRRLQYRRSGDEGFCLEISRRIVQGKLANCRTMAMRILRKESMKTREDYQALKAQLQRLETNLEKAAAEQDVAALRGLEGSGTRAYFAIFRAGLQWQGEAFKKRQRRPPKDPINAMLSLGYTLLTDALISAAAIAGLDPGAGYFHADKYGRPAMALDLIEEFRPLIVDSIVLTLVNKKVLDQSCFEAHHDGVYLRRKGLRSFFRQFSKRLNTRVYHPAAGRSLSYQKCFEIQARQMRKAIEGAVDAYVPMATR